MIVVVSSLKGTRIVNICIKQPVLLLLVFDPVSNIRHLSNTAFGSASASISKVYPLVLLVSRSFPHLFPRLAKPILIRRSLFAVSIPPGLGILPLSPSFPQRCRLESCLSPSNLSTRGSPSVCDAKTFAIIMLHSILLLVPAFGLVAQATELYWPLPTQYSEGQLMTCESTYGNGSIPCGGPESRWCFNPSLGQVSR